MKMFKKIMAVALTAVMAVSMLTGCAISDKINENAVRDALKGATGAKAVKDDKNADDAAEKGFKANKTDGASGTVDVKDGSKTKTYTYYTVEVDSYKKARQDADKLVEGLGIDTSKTSDKTLEIGVSLNTVEGKKVDGKKQDDTYYVTVAMLNTDLAKYQ